MFLQCPDSDGIAFANGNATKSGKGEPCCCVKGAAKVEVVGVREAAEAPIPHMNCEYSCAFAIQLLSCSREAPSGGGIVTGMPHFSLIIGTTASPVQLYKATRTQERRFPQPKLKQIVKKEVNLTPCPRLRDVRRN